MPTALRLFSPIRELLLLERSEAAILAYTPVQHARLRGHYDAATRRFDAARFVAEPVPASVLLCEAITHLLRAKEAASGGEAPSSFRRRDLVRWLPDPEPERGRPPITAADAQLTRAALTADDELYLDRLAPEVAEATRTALERTASVLRSGIDARTVAFVRGTRWGRLAACSVLALYLGYRLVAAVAMPVNIARGKPVSASSYRVNPPDGHELVDGSFPVSYGIHTNNEASPRVTIDLQGVYRIATVKVYNRGDGWQDEGLPIVAEISLDGITYSTIGRRDAHFDRKPPWVIEGRNAGARYVRLRGAVAGTYLALSQVEVFGKK